MRLDDVRGFVFDVDGSLVHRDSSFRAVPLPGAVEVLDAIRASGRPLVLFTNGSHLSPEAFARGLREVAKRESISYLRVEKDDDVVVWRRAA